MLLIYTEQLSNRIRYIMEFILGDLLGLEFEFTSDAEVFAKHDGPRMSYAKSPKADEVFFFANGFLNEKGVRHQELHSIPFEDFLGFFAANSQSKMPFDPFAAAFYLVSRYEEYLPSMRDKFGRYRPKESIAYKFGLLEKPVVDQWAIRIAEFLTKRYPDLKPKKRSYSYTPTYDIDSAYAYLHKGIIRTIGGYLKALREMDMELVMDRTRVLMRRQKDPYDTFDWLNLLQEKYHLSPIYFFLVGDYDEYDKNASVKDVNIQSLIKSVSDHAQVGIHPSFASIRKPEKLKMEIDRLTKILKQDTKLSRQHFLKIELPSTYQNLIDNDIEHDYSMGYATEPGFRAGTCTSFKWYNLELEVKTPLTIHPFCIMEACLIYYKNIPADKALDTVKPIIDAVKSVDGSLMTLCHNNSFTEEKELKGWRDAFEGIVKEAVS